MLAKQQHVPERKCVACGRKAPKSELVRIALTPQGAVVADPSGKAPGRGAYFCGSSDCWEQGLRKNSLERGLRSPISAQDRELLLNYYRENIAGQTPTEN